MKQIYSERHSGWVDAGGYANSDHNALPPADLGWQENRRPDRGRACLRPDGRRAGRYAKEKAKCEVTGARKSRTVLRFLQRAGRCWREVEKQLEKQPGVGHGFLASDCIGL